MGCRRPSPLIRVAATRPRFSITIRCTRRLSISRQSKYLNNLVEVRFVGQKPNTPVLGVAGRTVQNPTLAKRQGKEDDVVEDLSSPFLATHIVPCVPRWASDAFHGLSAWRDVSKKRHLSKRV